MAAMALEADRDASAEVVDLATRIEAAQGPEIEHMRAYLAEWGESEGMEGDTGSMGGQMSAEEMNELEAAEGIDFDSLWLAMMTAHHEGAIEMAGEVQGAGANAGVRELAGQIIAAQQTEIAEMAQLQDA